MPSKFVQNSAERAGVSVEKAEEKWAEAKKAVHKGKRRGSWYWGKVVNTFKRMMGLSEGLSFSEYLLLSEEETSDVYENFRPNFHLFGPYVARGGPWKNQHYKYEVVEMMGESTGITLLVSPHVSTIPHDEERAVWSVGKDGDYTTGLGVIVTGYERKDFEDFKKWAIDSLKQKAEKLGLTLTESESKDVTFYAWPNSFYVGGSLAAVLKARDNSHVHYELEQLMDDEKVFDVRIVAYRGDAGDGGWVVGSQNLNPSRKFDMNYTDLPEPGTAEDFNGFKQWVLRNIKELVGKGIIEESLTEAKTISIQQGTKRWPDRIMLRDGYYLEHERQGQTKRVYVVKRLMEDDIFGKFLVVKRMVGNELWYFWQMHDRAGGQAVSRYPTSGQFDPFDYADAKRWVNENLVKLGTITEAKKHKEGWYPITLYPISGRWLGHGQGPDLPTFFHKMDDVFGGDGNWDLTVSKDVRERLRDGKEIVVSYREGTIDMKAMKKHKLQIKFLEELDEDTNVDTLLKNKSEKSGIPVRTLRAVYNRGLAAWKQSHRPGTNSNQWAAARVNSFIKGGPARKSDQDLWDKRGK